MSQANPESLDVFANTIRRQTLAMINRARSAHIGTTFSMAEILAVLYGRVLRVDPLRPDWPDRDRFVLSKGHGCAGLYAALAERGFFPREWLDSFYLDGSPLVGHATHRSVPGVEVSTGSLGHGLSIAAGMALAVERDKRPYRVFALLSDGECDEGSTWEAILFAGHHRLRSLVAIVDYNKIQSLGRVSEVLELEPFADKWSAFGWDVHEVDGHDCAALTRVLEQRSEPGSGRPTCVIAHTVKGKGVTFMEDLLLWHYRSPDASEHDRAVRELEGNSGANGIL
jgi:transketolase